MAVATSMVKGNGWDFFGFLCIPKKEKHTGLLPLREWVGGPLII